MTEVTFSSRADIEGYDFEQDVDVVVVGSVYKEWHPDPEVHLTQTYAKVSSIFVFLNDEEVTSKVTSDSMRSLKKEAEEELCNIHETLS